MRTVREFERAGAAGIQIEDQVFPKRCGHMEGKRGHPAPSEMVEKLRAALDARTNPDTVIVARTDAIAVTGLDDAIDAGAGVRRGGADVIFVDAPRSRTSCAAIAGADRPAAPRQHLGVRQDPRLLGAGRVRGARLRDRAVSVVDAVRRAALDPELAALAARDGTTRNGLVSG